MKTIAWDIDDVLNDLMRCWFDDFFRPEHPGCDLRYAELLENPPESLLGVSREDYLASLDRFRLADNFQRMLPTPEVMSWFKVHGPGYRHVALTAVPLAAASASARWLMRHFGTWIRSFHFVPSARKGVEAPVYDEDKAAYLDWLQHVDVLVDDNQANIEAARRVGVKGLLFPRPWNDGGTSTEALLAEMARL